MQKNDPEQYAEALFEMLKETDNKQHSGLIAKFAQSVKAKGQAALLRQVIKSFDSKFNELEGIETIEITAATPIDISELQNMFGKKAEIKFTHDPSVEGGIKIKIGDMLVDNTLIARMAKLRESLGR